MPDYLGKDQRKTKDDKEDDKPIQGNTFHCLHQSHEENLCKISSLSAESLHKFRKKVETQVLVWI